MPKIGQLRSPWIEPARSAPMNGPVQANDASANTSPITRVPSKPPRLETLFRDVKAPLGTVISKTPSRLNPNATNTAVISRFTGTLDPSCVSPKGPMSADTAAPMPVNRTMTPTQNVVA